MNQLLIGQFISECRKEKQLTQAQLAEKLNITNRAVSKWETGNSIPDASIMLELCEILGINVNELLCGKRLDEKEEKKEGEKNIISLLLAKKELKNLRNCAFVLMFVGLMMITSVTSLMADTAVEKTITFSLGLLSWGYGLWLKVKVEKALNKTK